MAGLMQVTVWGITVCAALASIYSAYLWYAASVVQVEVDQSKSPPINFYKINGVDMGLAHCELMELLAQTKAANKLNAKAACATAVATILGFLTFLLQMFVPI